MSSPRPQTSGRRGSTGGAGGDSSERAKAEARAQRRRYVGVMTTVGPALIFVLAFMLYLLSSFASSGMFRLFGV